MNTDPSLPQHDFFDVPSRKASVIAAHFACLLRRTAETEFLSIATLLILCLCAWIPALGRPAELRWDASVYYVLGTSLAKGEGYRLLNEPGQIQAVQYPPGVATLIALHQIALSSTDPLIVAVWLRFSWFVLFCLFIILSYKLLRRYFPQAWCIAGAVFCIFHSGLFFYAGQASAEIPFAVASMVFFSARHSVSTKRREPLMAIAAVTAFLFRTMGIALLIAWAIDAVRQRFFGLATLRLALGAGCVLAWGGYTARVEHTTDYARPAYAYQRADYLFYNVSYARNMKYVDPYRPELGTVSARTLADRIVKSVRVLPAMLGTATVFHAGFLETVRKVCNEYFGIELLPRKMVSLVLAAVGCVVMLGILALIRTGEVLIPAYIVITILAVSTAPWSSEFVRYCTPLIPLLLLAAMYASYQLFLLTRLAKITILQTRVMRVMAGIVVLTLLVGQLATYFISHGRWSMTGSLRTANGQWIPYRQLWYQAPDIALDEAIDWAGSHAAPDDVIAASMPQWVYLRTGRKTVMPPFETDGSKELAFLDSVPVRYLIFENPTYLINRGFAYTEPMLRHFPDQWRAVFTATGGHATVYQRVNSMRTSARDNLLSTAE